MSDERARARDLLDLHEGRGAYPVATADQALELLRRSRRVAIVGASPEPTRPSQSVMRYLIHHGYECVPVNPRASSVLGLPSFPTLEEATAATGPFDIVDVFRRPEHAPAIARSAVATRARALWLQLGVVSWEAARIVADAGIPIVMDRCTAIDHRVLRSRR